MKSKYIILILSLFVLIILSTTNPSKQEYIDWFNTEAKLDNIFISWASKPAFNTATTKNDFLFFTVYKTTLGKHKNEQFTTLGICDHFIQLDKNEKK